MMAIFTVFLVLCGFGFAIAGDDSTKIFYAAGWDADRVDLELTLKRGNWTLYLDADRPWGTGEFEDVWRERMFFLGDCRALWCRNPVAMEVGLSPRLFKFKPDARLEDAWRCTNLPSQDPKRGFLCLARDQRAYRKRKEDQCYRELCQKAGLNPGCRRCFDAKVRYFCMQADMECAHNVFPGDLNEYMSH